PLLHCIVADRPNAINRLLREIASVLLHPGRRRLAGAPAGGYSDEVAGVDLAAGGLLRRT
ncbi:MAG: hypothetical protein JXB13_02895, partial [Phycisphaerae bacterium]|nr:hypothetical protein [Phycisphaerae bacterium]